MELPSSLIDDALKEISKIPGIGRKSAFRIVLFLLRQPLKYSKSLSGAILNLREKIHYCKICHNISDNDICLLCLDDARDKSLVCIVENFQDIIAIENTNQYKGLYHVLGNLISPIDGIGPAELNIDSLFSRIEDNKVSEIIFALSNTDEGETTAYYIIKKIKNNNINFTMISRGISAGNEIEYIDEITLGRSILERVPFN